MSSHSLSLRHFSSCPRSPRFFGGAQSAFIRFAIALALAVPFIGGCSNSSSDDSPVSVTFLQIATEHELFSGTDTYDWASAGTVGRIELHVRGFQGGGLQIRVRDASNGLIYEKLFDHWDDLHILDPDTYLDIDTTNDGVPGDWTVEVEFVEFTGSMYLTVELDQPKTEPSVPTSRFPVVGIDGTFAIGGLAAYAPGRTAATDVIRDTADRLVVVGTIVDEDGLRALAAWRFLDDGSLDSGFGMSGIFQLGGALPSAARSVTVDGLGSIVVSGWRQNSAG